MGINNQKLGKLLEVFGPTKTKKQVQKSLQQILHCIYFKGKIRIIYYLVIIIIYFDWSQSLDMA